jgi:hypothetical protein
MGIQMKFMKVYEKLDNICHVCVVANVNKHVPGNICYSDEQIMYSKVVFSRDCKAKVWEYNFIQSTRAIHSIRIT